MMPQNYGTCRYCHRQILWQKTVKGHNIPLNPEALHIIPDKGPEKLVTPDGAIVFGKLDPEGTVMGYRSHFADCPGAHKARKSDRKQRGRY